MSDDSFRERMNQTWLKVDREARERRDSMSAYSALRDFYRSLSDEERHVADEVIVEWAWSPDRSYDGLGLIDEFRIRSAVPSLRRLAAAYAIGEGPENYYGLRKVERILRRLVADAPCKDDSVDGDGAWASDTAQTGGAPNNGIQTDNASRCR